MNARESYLDSRLRALGLYRVQAAQRIASDPPVDGALLLALGVRESGCRNVVGDHGDARGWLQINDRFHSGFLKGVPGCKLGFYDLAAHRWVGDEPAQWHRVPGATALDEGYGPRFSDAATYVAGLIAANLEQASDLGVGDVDLLEVAVAAFNAGMGGAMRGYREQASDRHTTGGDYSADVLKRRGEIGAWLNAHPTWRP